MKLYERKGLFPVAVNFYHNGNEITKEEFEEGIGGKTPHEKERKNAITELLGEKVFEIAEVVLCKGNHYPAQTILLVATYFHTYIITGNGGVMEYYVEMEYETETGETVKLNINKTHTVKTIIT